MPAKRLNCEYEGCNKSYCCSFNLKRHIELIHLGIRRFKCEVCSKMLSSKQNLLDHLNVHSGAKPYVCEFPGCRVPFRQLSQYYIHRTIHKNRVEISQNFEIVSERLLSMLLSRASVESSFEYYLEQERGLEKLPKIDVPGGEVKLPVLDMLVG